VWLQAHASHELAEGRWTSGSGVSAEPNLWRRQTGGDGLAEDKAGAIRSIHMSKQCLQHGI
jgi:hypothetical protein